MSQGLTYISISYNVMDYNIIKKIISYYYININFVIRHMNIAQLAQKIREHVTKLPVM